jgi:UDP-glucose 4-epimerase
VGVEIILTKVAVTGASGFIGHNIVKELKSKGWDVVSLVEEGVSVSNNIHGVYPVEIVSGKGLLKPISGVDVVIHCAARNHVLKDKEANPLAEYRSVNVDGTRNVIRSAIHSGVKLFIHFSSIKAMGEESEDILNEDSPKMPRTFYGMSKFESEEVVRNESSGSGMRVVILRLPMVYGPGNKGNLPRMIHWASRGLPFPIFGFDNLRSMIYVGNVIHGTLLAVRKAIPGVTDYIVTDGEDYSTRRVYTAICRELGKAPRFLPVPAWIVRLGGQLSGDVRRLTGSFRASSGKIRKELGYSPPYTLEQGIAETVRWYKRSAR